LADEIATVETSSALLPAQRVVDTNEVKFQVGAKAAGGKPPVCACFGCTALSLADDLVEHGGRSEIASFIEANIARGSTACELVNPTGQHCLANVVSTIKTIKTLIIIPRD
jgi:hypothetical protein